MIVLGLDLSLTGTGYVLLKNGKIKEQKLIKSKPSGKKPADELKRLMKIREQITLSKIDIAVIEGLSFMAKNSVSLVQLSALNYMVREHLWTNKIPFLIVAPTTLKKFVTGKGNAKKDEMLLAVYRRWKFVADNSDIADAYGLAKIGQCMLDHKQATTNEQKECLLLLKKQLDR